MKVKPRTLHVTPPHAVLCACVALLGAVPLERPASMVPTVRARTASARSVRSHGCQDTDALGNLKSPTIVCAGARAGVTQNQTFSRGSKSPVRITAFLL